jgi:hypothetical protein
VRSDSLEAELGNRLWSEPWDADLELVASDVQLRSDVETLLVGGVRQRHTRVEVRQFDGRIRNRGGGGIR